MHTAAELLTDLGPTVISMMGIGSGLWWFKRFVDRTETKIDHIVDQFGKLNTTVTVLERGFETTAKQMDKLSLRVHELRPWTNGAD